MNICLLKRGLCLTVYLRSQKALKVPTCNVYAGTAADRLLEPYFFPPRLTGAVEHNSHRNALPELPPDVDLQTVIYLWSMHDSATPHFVLPVRQFLNSVFLT